MIDTLREKRTSVTKREHASSRWISRLAVDRAFTEVPDGRHRYDQAYSLWFDWLVNKPMRVLTCAACRQAAHAERHIAQHARVIKKQINRGD